MMQYRCDNCERRFTGENARQDIRDHVMDCVIVEEEVPDLDDVTKQVIDAYPFVETIESRISQVCDERQAWLIQKKDGSSYYVYHHFLANGAAAYETEAVRPFDVIAKGIDHNETIIAAVLQKIKEALPDLPVTYVDQRENSGYKGNGFRFLIPGLKPVYPLQTKGETHRVFYGKEADMDSFVSDIKAHFVREIRGEITGNNGKHRINGVSLFEWLSIHKGKRCIIRLEEENLSE